MHDPMYGQREPRYISDRPAQRDGLNLDELADALEHLREKKRPLHGRRASEYARMHGYGGYEGYNQRGY